MTRVGISGITSYWAIRAYVRDAPEDFLARIESGLDPETATSLRRGVRAANLVVRMQWISFGTLVLGFLAFLAGALVPWVGSYVLYIVSVLWLVTLGSFTASILLAGVRYRDISRLETFVEAMRRSSLARDLG